MAGLRTREAAIIQYGYELLVECQARDTYRIRADAHERQLIHALKRAVERQVLSRGELRRIAEGLDLHDLAENADHVARRADVRQAAGIFKRHLDEEPAGQERAQRAG